MGGQRRLGARWPTGDGGFVIDRELRGCESQESYVMTVERVGRKQMATRKMMKGEWRSEDGEERMNAEGAQA